MSEFQYYEFQALDQTLSTKDIAALREYSSRARISSSRFVNHYSYGNFKGNVKKWMERYFDAFLYKSSCGTRRLIFRFANQTIDPELLVEYCKDECAKSWRTGRHIFVEYCVDECEGEEWFDEDDVSLSNLIPLRTEVTLNDYRLFYLGWLLSVQYGEVDSESIEPPLPLGLGSLSPALEAFVDFFALDRDLLKSAASNSTFDIHEISTDDIEPCIALLSNSSKNSWLCRLVLGDDPNLQARFRKQILPDCGLDFFSDKSRRKVAEIIANY